MVIIKEKDSNKYLGSISDLQLQVLVDALEEEHKSDQDYWINRVTLDAMKENGADADLISFIEKAMGDRDDIEIVWSRS